NAYATTYDVTYYFDVNCGSNVSGTCGSFTPIGSVHITGTDTSLKYDFALTNGAIWDSGITTAFADVSGAVSGVVTSNNAPSGATWGTFNFDTKPDFDGLKSGTWNVWFDCTITGATNCGTEVAFTISGTNLAPVFNTIGGFKIYAGLDTSCDPGNLTSGNTA